MEINIRKAKWEDVKKIWKIGNTVSEFKTSDEVVLFWPEETLNNCIDKEDILFYVVEAEENIVGFSIVNLNKSLGKAEIENVYIDAQYRKHGIGRKLLNTIIEELKEKGFENVNCLADEAIGFYERNGFIRGKSFAWMDMIISEKFRR